MADAQKDALRAAHIEILADLRGGYRGETLAALHAAIAALTRADAVAPEGVRCTSCDGTGDLIRADGEWTGYCPCTRPSAAPAAETGFVLVPREPTEKMRREGRACIPYELATIARESEMDHAYYVYTAMLAATPTQDAAHGGRDDG
jgi:hypothetical protein